MGEAKWKAFIDGKKYGPVDEDTIQRWIDEERITARTQLWCAGMTRWVAAADVREFGACFEATVAVSALPDDPVVPAPAPAPKPVPQPAPAPRGPQVDHDAATLIQESPFVEEKMVPVAQSGWPTTEERVAVRETARPSAGPRPSLPLLPIVLSLLALLPAGALVYVAVIKGDLAALPTLDRALLGGTAFGLLLLVLLPLFYNGIGLLGGLLGALVTLGSWAAFLAKDLVPVYTVRPRLLGLSYQLQQRFIDGLSGDFGVAFVATLLNWLALVVPFLALLYYLFTRKYRARIRHHA